MTLLLSLAMRHNTEVRALVEQRAFDELGALALRVAYRDR